MAQKQTLPSVTQYTKNVIKSTLYASSGVAENLMPGYLEFKETNKEIFKAAYVAIRDYRKTFQRVKDAITKSKVYEAADKGLENIKSDLRTGMWYNKGRETEFDNQAMMSGDDFGLGEMTGGSGGGGGDLGLGDIDFNMDDIFGDEKEPSEDELLDITDGDEMIADTVKKTSAKSTAAINDIQVKGVEVLLKSNRAAANMAYVQSEKMMKIAEEGFSTLNQTTSNILKFNTEGLQKHIENAASYFTNTEKLAQERNAMLKELVEMQRNIYKMYQIQEEKKDDPNKPKKYTWGAITTSSGMPALDEYFGAIKQNFERELDNAGMGMIKAMSGLAGENPLLAMVQNPLGDLVTMMVATALGPMVANAAKGLDRNLSSLFGNFIASMNHLGDEGEGPLSLIGKIFGIRDIAKNTLDTANYKKGPMPWDGESKKALVEVIPHYLANIEAALTGRHQLFDYQTGRYVDSAALKDQYLSIVDRYAYQPFNEVDQLMRDFFKTFTMYRSEDQKELVKTWVNMKKYASAGKGRWKNMFNFDTSRPREDEEELDDLAMEVGSDKKYIRDILNYLKMATGKGDKNNPAAKLRGQRGLLMEVEGKIMESKERQTRDFTNMEEQGTILNQLFNNGYMQWRDSKGILRNNQTFMEKMHLKYQKDDRGNNIFYYLQRILGSLMLIQTEGFGLGDSKQMKAEMVRRQQRRKIHRGQKTDGLIKPPAQSNQTMHRIEAMMSQIREDEYQKEKTDDELYNKREREIAERTDKQTEEKAKKQAEDKNAGKLKRGSIIYVGMDNRNKPDDETYTTLVDAGIRDMHSRDVDEEQVHFAEMTRVMEQMMINGVKQADNKNEADKTWLGRQYAKFKESNDEEDKKYRAEIQKVGFLDALLQADDIGDKWGTIRVGLEDLAQKPSALLTKVLEEADERLYQFFFTEEEIEDKRNGKKYKGFFGRMRAHLDNLFVDMNEGLNKYLFQPLKDKLGVEGPWDAVKKGLGYIGIDVDAIGSEVKANMNDGLKSVWENIKETVTEFFSDAAESIAEDERKARELNSKDETYTKQFEDWVTGGSSSDKKEEKKEETKKVKFTNRVEEIMNNSETGSGKELAKLLGFKEKDMEGKSDEELRIAAIERRRHAKQQKRGKNITDKTKIEQAYDEIAEAVTPQDTLKGYLFIARNSEDYNERISSYDRILTSFTDNSEKIKQIKNQMELIKSEITRIDSDISTYAPLAAYDSNDNWEFYEDLISTLNKSKKDALSVLPKLSTQLLPLESVSIDKQILESVKKEKEALEDLTKSNRKKDERESYKAEFDEKSKDQMDLTGYGVDQHSERISELREQLGMDQKYNTGGLDTRTAFNINDRLTRAMNTGKTENLFRSFNGSIDENFVKFSKANPKLVFKAYEPSIKEWISGSLGVKNKAAAQHIVDKLRKEFIDNGGDIERILTVKIIKGIIDDIAKAYEENRDNTPIARSIFESKAGLRLNGVAPNENILDYLNEKNEEYDIVESVDEAAKGITDLNELIKVSLNEDSPIYKKLDEILNALNRSNQEQNPIDDSLIDEYANRLGFAQGRESLELAPAETAIVSKGEIIKPLVGPSEKITKTGLYNLGRGDAVIPNPSQATIERNKIEESNKLNEISKDIASGNDISKHMATTKRYSLGRGIFNIDAGDNVEVTEKEDKDNLISLSIGYAKGRDNIYNLDDKKGQEEYVNNIVKALTEDLPKYAESRPPVRIEATDEAKLNYILSNKDRFKNQEFDPEQIAILGALIKGEKEDNRYKKNEAKTLSNISDMYGYLVKTIEDMIDGKKDDEKIKVGNKEVTVKELKTINSFIRRSKQTAYNTEVTTGISTSTVGRLIGDGINNAKEGAIEILTGLTGLESENVKKSVKETYAEVKKGMPNVIAKGTVGLIGGTLLGGPLVGALLGSAVGVAESSETFRSTLFGTAIRDKETNEVIGRKNDGLIGKETIEAYKKYMPGIKGYGLLGTALGLVTPFGLLGGALLGAGFGAVSRTDEFQAAFFGKKGILDKDARDFFKKAAPNAAAAAAAMAFLGPFGLVGNLFVGSAAGMLASTEQFKTYMFGKEDDEGRRRGGIVHALKNAVVDPWLDFGKKVSKELFGWIKTDVFGPLKGAIAPIGKQLQLGITGLITGMGRFIRHWSEVILGKQIVKTMENFVKKWITRPLIGLANMALKPAKFILSAPSKMIGAVGDVLRRRQVALGNADYMSAGERMEFRRKNRMNTTDQYATFDSKIATASTDNLSSILEAAKLMETGDKGLKQYRDESIRKLFANIDSYLVKNGEDTISMDQKEELEKLLMSDDARDVDEASKMVNRLTSNLGGTQQKKVRDVLEKMTQDVFAKKSALENYRNYGEDAIAKLFKDELGIDADNNNIGKFRSMLEKELSVRKGYDKDVKEGKVSAAEDLLNKSIIDQTSVLGSKLTDIVVEIKALSAGLLTQEQIKENEMRMSGYRKDTEKTTKMRTEEMEKLRWDLELAYDKDRVDRLDDKDYNRLTEKHRKFGGRSLGSKLVEMGKAGFDPQSLRKLTQVDNEVIYRAVKLFDTVGYQTDDLKKLEKLSEEEFSNVIESAIAGLQFKSFDEVKDLTNDEIKQILYIYDVSGISPQKMPVDIVKNIIRRDGFGTTFMNQDRATAERYFATHRKEIENLKTEDRDEEVRKTGSGNQNLRFKEKKTPIISNILLNSVATTGHDTMEALGTVGRWFGHDPVREHDKTTTKEKIDQVFASSESLRDFSAQLRSAIERHLDPENEKGTKAIADIMGDAIIREIKRGHSIESIEQMFNTKIKRNEEKGGYDISGYNGNAVRITNKQIEDFKKEYSEYDDLYRFFQVVMDNPQLQDKVRDDLLDRGFNLDQIASYLKSEQYRGPITKSERKPIDKVLLSGYSEDVIKDFKEGRADPQQQRDMMNLLLSKGYTEQEIEDYKKGIQGHASGRLGVLSTISNRLGSKALHYKYRIKGYWENNKDKLLAKLEKLSKDMAIQETIGQAIRNIASNFPEDSATREMLEFVSDNKLEKLADVIQYLDPEAVNQISLALNQATGLNMFAEGRPTFFDYHDDPDSESYTYAMQDMIRDRYKEAFKPKPQVSYSNPMISQNLASILSNATGEVETPKVVIPVETPKVEEPVVSYTARTNNLLQIPKSDIISIPNNNPNPNASIIIPGQETTGSSIILPGQENVNPNAKLIIPGKEENKFDLSDVIQQQKQNETIKNLRQSSKILMAMNSGVVDDFTEDIEVPKIENEVKTQFEGIESENSLRFMVYNQVKKFNEMGLTPNQDILGKLDYKNGLVGLINSGFSMKKLFEYDPKNMEVKFTDVDGKEFKVNADFYENMSAEEQSNLMKSLISQSMNKDNNGILTIATPDGDRQIKIADEKAKSIQVPTMYGVLKQTLSSDGSYVDDGKDSADITEKVTQDHEARLSTASDISEIKDFILSNFGKKEKPKEEKKSFMEMLMDLLKMLAAFFIGGGLLTLLGAASDNLSALIGRAFRSALSLTEKAIVNAINEAAKPFKDLAEKLKVKLNISRIKVPKLGEATNIVRGTVREEEAALAAKLARINGTEGATGPKGKAFNTFSEAEAAEFKALQEKGLDNLTDEEKTKFNNYNNKVVVETKINGILDKVRTGGLGSLTAEELKMLDGVASHNEIVRNTSLQLNSMYEAKLSESEKAIRESAKRTSQIFNSEIGEKTFGDVKSSIKEKLLGGQSLTGAELERRAMLMANKGMASEYILQNLGVELKDGQLVKTGAGLSSERSALVSGLENTKNFGKFMGQQVVDGTKAVGEAIGEKFERVGNKITAGFDAATQPIRNVGSAISQGIGEATSKITTGMLGQYTKEDIAKVVENMQQKGATNQEIANAVKEMQGSQRTFLGNAIDRARGIGPVFEGGELNFGATTAEAGERGLTEKLASAVVKAHTLPMEVLATGGAMAGTALGAAANTVYSPFKKVGEIASNLDTQLAQDIGMKYKAATFAPRLLLGMPGLYVDSVKDTFKTGKELLTGGFNASLGRDIDAALNIGAREALGEGATTTQKIVRAGVEAGESILGPVSRGLHQFVGIVAKKLGQFISLVPGLENSRVAKGLLELSDNMAKVLVKKAIDRAATLLLLQRLSKLCNYYLVYEIASKLYEGFSNPGVILHIKDQDKIDNGLRFVAALANVLSLATLGFVEPKTIADLCLDVFGDIIGFSEEERKMQEESIEEYEAWRATVAEGGDDSFEAFLKASGTFNDKGLITNVGNFIWEGFKGITSEIPQFIMGKLSEGAESMFKLGDHVRSITEYWNKLSDRSSAIMNGLGKLTDAELARLDAGVEIAPDDPLFGIKNTMKDFAANHWFIMASVGWAIGKIGSIFGGIFDGAGDMINGIKSQLSANFSAMIEGDPIKILSNLWNGDGSESRTGFMNGVGRVVTMIATVPTLTIATILSPIRLIRSAYEKVEASFESFPQAKDNLDEMSRLADSGEVMAIWDLDNPFNSSMASGVGDLLAGIMYGIGKTGYMALGAFNFVSQGIHDVLSAALTPLAGKEFTLDWYRKYELKTYIDPDYLNHAQYYFDPKHPLTAIPSAVETLYKIFNYPIKLIGLVFRKFSEGGGIISTLIDKAKAIFGSMDDIDKQNRSMVNKPQPTAANPDPRSATTKAMAPSALDRSADAGADGKQALHEISAEDAAKILRKPNEFSKGLDSDEKRNKVDSIVKAALEQNQEDFQRIYEEDKRIQNMLLKIHESKDLQKKRNDMRLLLEQEGFTVDDETLEAMVYNVIRGKNVYGKGTINTRNINLYLQNAPGNEKIKYNIPGDTKVDTVAARACGPFAMGAAKDYVTGTRTNMGKELKLGRSYLAPDDGTKFDYFKDSGNKSGLDVKQTSDMSEIDKATKDPNSAVVGMVDTGRGIHYETFTDKVDTKGKSYYNTIDPEKPNQVLSDKDTISKQLKTSFIVKRATGRRGIYGKGNEMRIDPQSTSYNCTAYSTMAMLRAYYNEENDDSTINTKNWAGIMDGFATETNFGNSESEKQRFISEINKYYDTHPNHPMLLYQTGGDGSYGSHPINHGGGSHATVIGRRLDNGMFEDYDPNGGIVHTLPLDEIFDPSARGGVEGMPSNGGNSVWIPKIDPSSPIDRWQGTGQSDSTGGPRTDSNGIIYNNASANTNSGSIFDKAITNSAPISNLTKLYNAIFGGDTGGTQINTPADNKKSSSSQSTTSSSSSSGETAAVSGNIPQYKQFDEQWQNSKWLDLHNSGCAPTSTAIQAEAITGKTHTPVMVGDWAVDNGYRNDKPGLIQNYAKANGYNVQTISYADDSTGKPAYEAMKSGLPVVIGLEAGSLGGLGGSGGHYLVGQGIQDGDKVLINNPGRNNEIGNEGFEAKHTWKELISTTPDFYIPVKDSGDTKHGQYGEGTDIQGYNGPEFNKITDNDSISVQQSKLEAQQKYMNTLSKPEQSKIWNTNIVDETTKSLKEKDKIDVLSKWKQGSKFIGLQDRAAKVIPFRTDVDTTGMTGDNKRTIDEAFKAKEDLEQAVIKKNGVPFVKGKNINQRIKDSNFLAEMRRRIFTPKYGRGYEDYGNFEGSDIDTRAKYIWSYLKSSGMSDAGAAGVIGNFRVEDPPLHPGYSYGGDVYNSLEENISATGGTAYGLAQWLWPSRQDNLMAFAKANNLSSGSLEAQLGYAKKEATEGYDNIWGRFAEQSDPVEAAKTWMDEYEAPGEVSHWDRRAEEAAKAYTEFSGKTYDNIKLPSDSSSSTGSTNTNGASSSGGVVSNTLGLIDKILLPAVDKAIEKSGYLEKIKDQYGIDIKASDLRGGNIPGGNTSSSSTSTGSTTVAATSNGGAASGDSVGQAMLNFVPGSEITSPFGPRTLNGSADFHNGIDIGYAGDTPVYSPITAKVDEAGSESGYGNYVVLKDDAGKYYMFAHLNAHSVKTGQDVKPGDQLGLSGNTGHSFGDHLHFGIHDDAGCLKNPDTSHDPMSYPLGKGTTEDAKNAMKLSSFVEDGLNDISGEDIDNYITVKKIETGQYGMGTREDKREDVITKMASDMIESYKNSMKLKTIVEEKEEEKKESTDITKYTTPGTFPDLNKQSKTFDLGSIFGGLLNGGTIFGPIDKPTTTFPSIEGEDKSNSPMSSGIGDIFKPNTTTFPDLGNNTTGGFNFGNIFGGLLTPTTTFPNDNKSSGFDLGSIFSGGSGGMFGGIGDIFKLNTTTFPDLGNNTTGGFDLGNIFGGLTNNIGESKHSGLIQTGIGLIGDWFNRRNERRKEREEQYKAFTPFTTESTDIPEGLSTELLISGEDDDKTKEKKKKKQFKFMRKNNLLPEKKEEETSVPEIKEEDIVDKPEDTDIPKLHDHTEEEANREQEIKEIKPPSIPKVEEETKEEVEEKAKRDIVEGNGYSDHLEAKIGQGNTNTSTDIASGSNFDKLLEVLNIIANNTGKLVELFGGNGNTTNNTVNMNIRNNNIASPSSAKTGRNSMNDMLAIANNLISMISK